MELDSKILSLSSMENQDANPSVLNDSVRLLYRKLLEGESSGVFDAWRNSFEKIHGSFNTQRTIKLEKIGSPYGIELTDHLGLFRLVFCLETYYSILLRLVGLRAISNERLTTSNLPLVMNGSYFAKLGILNYRCDERYDWFLSNGGASVLLDPIVSVLNSIEEVGQDKGLIRLTFERLFPPRLRHSMGEFNTPPWLVEFVINELIKNDHTAPFRRYLDPTCGSGSFLVQLLTRFMTVNPRIVYNIFGVDLNPVSVLA